MKTKKQKKQDSLDEKKALLLSYRKEYLKIANICLKINTNTVDPEEKKLQRHLEKTKDAFSKIAKELGVDLHGNVI